MNITSGKFLLVASLVAVLCVSASTAKAVSVTDADLFSSSQIVTASSSYSGSFLASSLVDGTVADFVFGASDTNQRVSITGFTSSIDTLRFFDQPGWYGRISKSVTIYYSSASTTSLDTASYTLLGTYTLPTTAERFYTNASTDTSTRKYSGEDYRTIYYAELTDLGIAAGTQSILMVFSRPNMSCGLSEIQAYAAVPEPCTMGLMLAGAVGMVIRRRRK